MARTWEETKKYIACDIYRNTETYKSGDIFKCLFGSSPLNLIVYFRICNYFASKSGKNPVEFLIHAICYARFNRLKQICGVELNQRTQIGYGLRIPHKGGIIIHPLSVIGNNCEIMQGVTIGNNIMKDRDAVAKIGNGVLLSSGAKIIGGITIGDYAIVGANGVVVKDVAEYDIVGGVPAKVIGISDGRHVLNVYDRYESN